MPRKPVALRHELTLLVIIKLMVIIGLWWAFVRDAKVEVDSERIATHLAAPAVAASPIHHSGTPMFSEQRVDLSRLQFTVTAMYHFLFVPLTIVGVIGTAGVSLLPFIMPSSTDLRSSLTVWDSVSSQLTLNIMLWATLIFMPLIIVYTSWAYKVMAGKVTAAYIRENEHAAY